MLQVEVAVKEAKEDNTGDEIKGQAVLRKDASSSFERVSQEIEKASQELPQSKQACSGQQGKRDGALAHELQPGTEPQDRQALDGMRDSPGHLLASAQCTGLDALQSVHTAPQRAPLQPMHEQRSLSQQRIGRHSQETLHLSSQQTGSAVSRGSSHSISESGRMPPVHSSVRRPLTGPQQPPAHAGIRGCDAGHILLGYQQGSSSALGPAQQRSAQHIARGLREAASQHRHFPVDCQQGSQRAPPLQRSHPAQGLQHLSQQGKAHSLGSFPAHPTAPAHARLLHSTQSRNQELHHPAAGNSGHVPTRPSHGQPSAPRRSMRPVSGSQAEQQRPFAPQSSGPPGLIRQNPAMQTMSQQAAVQQDCGSRAAPLPGKVLSDIQQSNLVSSHPQDASKNTGVLLRDSSKMVAARSGKSVLSGDQNTRPFTVKSTGVFANDDDDDDGDDDWDAEVVKLLENAALARPTQQLDKAPPQVLIIALLYNPSVKGCILLLLSLTQKLSSTAPIALHCQAARSQF